MHDVVDKLEAAGILAFELGPPCVAAADIDFMRWPMQAAKRTYSHSVAVTREVMGSVRMGQAPNIKKIKAGGADHRRPDPQRGNVAVGLTDHPRLRRVHTFTPPVNVCISVAFRQAPRPDPSLAVRPGTGGAPSTTSASRACRWAC